MVSQTLSHPPPAMLDAHPTGFHRIVLDSYEFALQHGLFPAMRDGSKWDDLAGRYNAQTRHGPLSEVVADGRELFYFCVLHDGIAIAQAAFYRKTFTLGLIEFGYLELAFPLTGSETMVARVDGIQSNVFKRLLRVVAGKLCKAHAAWALFAPALLPTFANGASVIPMLSGAATWQIRKLDAVCIEDYFRRFRAKKRKRLRQLWSRVERGEFTYEAGPLRACNVDEVIPLFKANYEKWNGPCRFDFDRYVRSLADHSEGRLFTVTIYRAGTAVGADLVCTRELRPGYAEVSLTGYDYSQILNKGVYDLLYLCETDWLIRGQDSLCTLDVGRGSAGPKSRIGAVGVPTSVGVLARHSLASSALHAACPIVNVLRSIIHRIGGYFASRRLEPKPKVERL